MNHPVFYFLTTDWGCWLSAYFKTEQVPCFCLFVVVFSLNLEFLVLRAIEVCNQHQILCMCEASLMTKLDRSLEVIFLQILAVFHHHGIDSLIADANRCCTKNVSPERMQAIMKVQAYGCCSSATQECRFYYVIFASLFALGE